MNLDSDSRIVMTLDAGGTNFRFAAARGGKPVTATVALPSHGDDLERCLAGLSEGFCRPDAEVAVVDRQRRVGAAQLRQA